MPDIATRDIASRDIASRDIASAAVGGSTVVYDWGDLGLPANTGDAATFPTVGDADGNRLVLDWEDRWIPVLAEELRYNGWRRVENLLPASEDHDIFTFTNSSSDGIRVTTSAQFGQMQYNLGASGDYAGDTLVARFKIRSISGNTNLHFNFEGSGVGTPFTITADWQVISVSNTQSGGVVPTFRIQDRNASDFAVYEVTEMQMEKVTGQSNQNPAEYVSTGVATGDELILAQGTSQWVAAGTNTVTDGGDGSVLVTYIDNGNGAGITFDDDESVCAAPPVIGKTYVVTGQVKVGSGDTVRLQFEGISTTENEDFTSTSYVDFKFVGVCNTTTTFRLQVRNMGIGETINIRNVSLKEADHGWNVDGVKYFETENGNTVSSNVVTEATGSAIAAATLKGYFAEGAATELSGYSQDLTDAAWSKNFISVAQDATGMSGAANEAFTLTDSNGSNSADERVSITITDDSNTYYSVIMVAYDASPSVYPFFYFIFSDGSAIAQSIVFDPSDGSYVAVNTSGSVVSVTRVGGFWRVIIAMVNNSTGNTTAQIRLHPAYNTDGSATNDVTAQGSTVIASAELYKTNYSFSPILTTGGTTKSRLADTEMTLPFDWDEVDAAGSIELEVTPYFVDGLASDESLISSGLSSRLIKFQSVAKRLRISDGSDNEIYVDAWSTVADTIAVKARWGDSTMRMSVDGVSDSSATYDGSFDPSGLVTLFEDVTRGAAIKNLVVYNEDKGDAWLEE